MMNQQIKQRPTIIAVYSILNYLVGIILFVYALTLVFSGQAIIAIAVSVALGLIGVLVGYGLWTGKRWAIVLQVIALSIAAGLSLKYLISTAYLTYLISLILSLAILITFFLSNNIRLHFNTQKIISKENVSIFKKFVKDDSFNSLLVTVSLAVLLIAWAFFPFLTWFTGSNLPLVVVESCSMYHESDFNSWWDQNAAWYERNGITKEDFQSYSFKGGLNKGDIIIVWGHTQYKKGDIIIFNAPTQYPIIHRLVSLSPLQTKGDHNFQQISGIETNIGKDKVIGKAVARIPLLGWIKLFLYEPFQPPEKRGFCS